MRPICSKTKIPLLILMGAIVVSIVVGYFLIIDKTPTGHNVFSVEGDDAEIHFLIYLATLAIAVIAFIEFERSNKLNTTELLTFISNRWSSKEIIKSRQIIHEVFVQRYRYDQENKLEKPEDKFKYAIKNSSNDIYEMSKKTGEEGKNFVYLLNLLDHFENVSYLRKKDQIDLEDLKNIYGNNIIFYYEIFEKYIDRRKMHNPNDFINFSDLYFKLNSSKS